MGRRPCCAKEGLNRGPWSSQEDNILINYIQAHGDGKWRDLPKNAGLKRCGKSCRLRWLNYLRPDIKRGNISMEEEELIIRLHKLLGNRWSLIAGRLPGRTDNEIKNYWNTKLRKRVHGKKTSRVSKKKVVGNFKDTQLKSSQNLASENHHDQAKPVAAATETPNRLFRTKATRCTKVIMINPQPLLDYNNNNNDFQTTPSSASPPMLQDDHSLDLLLNLDIDDLLLLDQTQDSNISSNDNINVVGGDYQYSVNTLEFPISTLEAQLDDILIDHKGPESWDQGNDCLDINHLTTFPSLEDEWII